MWAEGGEFREDDGSTLKMLMGERWHQVLGGGTDPDKSHVSDGIVYTPDEVMVEERADGTRVVREYKTTKYSANKSVGEMAQYFDQLGGYCVFEQTLDGELYVLHINGYYWTPTGELTKEGKPKKEMNSDPVLRVFQVRFNPFELQGFRRELARRRRIFIEAESLEDIPVGEAYEFECAWCPLKKNKLCPGVPKDGGRTGAFSFIEEVAATPPEEVN